MNPTFPNDATIEVKKEEEKTIITIDNREDVVTVVLDAEKVKELIALLEKVSKVTIF